MDFPRIVSVIREAHNIARYEGRFEFYEDGSPVTPAARVREYLRCIPTKRHLLPGGKSRRQAIALRIVARSTN